MIRPPDPTAGPSNAPRRHPGAIDLRVRIELLDIGARSGIFAGWATICVAGFTWALLRGTSESALLTTWVVAMGVVSVASIAIFTVWRRLRDGDGSDHPAQGGLHRFDLRRVRRWEFLHAGAAFCVGLSWATLVAFAIGDVAQTSMLIGFTLTVALVISGSFYATNRLACALYALPIIVAQEINLLRLPADANSLVAAAWLGLVVLLYFMPRISSISLREGLTARVEHERRASEQATLLETAPLGILVIRDAIIVACNEALLTLLGYGSKDELVGHNVRIVIADDDAWQQMTGDATAALRGRVPPRIVRRRRKDGSVVDLMRNVAAIHGGDGEREFIGIYEDVQQRVAIEEGYRDAVHMQRLVFESAGEGIAIVNDGVIEQANQALADLVGQPVGLLGGQPLHAIFEDPQGWIEIEKRFQRLGNVLKLERKVIRSDGRAIWANVTGCLVDASPAPANTSTGSGLRSIWILADLSVQKQKEAENWHHANHDVMTGLPNRRFLQDRLDQALAFARRDGRRVAVLELDLDGFKSVNDSYGHRFGDAVLEEVARRLSMVVRELDTVGRWGGDEFVLVLKEIESREIVEDTVKRVIVRLSEPIVYQGQNLSIGASIGIALFPDHGEEVETLMLAADLAMYESKSSGGNTWRFSSPTAQPPRGKYRPAASTVTTTAADLP